MNNYKTCFQRAAYLLGAAFLTSGLVMVCICLNVKAVAAQEPLSFVDTQPPIAFEGEHYEYQVGVIGGEPPYHFSLRWRQLPPGLNLSSDGFISGNPSTGANNFIYQFIIRVTDSSSNSAWAEKPFAMLLMYKSTISVDSSLAEGETGLYIDGDFAGRLKGGDKISREFLAGTHKISVEPNVYHPTNPDIKFIPTETSISIDGLHADASFSYSHEYHISLDTDPLVVRSLLPDSSKWDTLTGWYKEYSMLQTDTLNKIATQSIYGGKTDTEYRFSHWSLPGNQSREDNNLEWRVNSGGKVTAVYDTHYYLTIDSKYGIFDGEDWYKAGTPVNWHIKVSGEIFRTELDRFLRAPLRPIPQEGTTLMYEPHVVTIEWVPDYTGVTGFVFLTLFLGFLSAWLYEKFHKGSK